MYNLFFQNQALRVTPKTKTLFFLVLDLGEGQGANFFKNGSLRFAPLFLNTKKKSGLKQASTKLLLVNPMVNDEWMVTFL